MTNFYDLPPTAMCEKGGLMSLHQQETNKLKRVFCTVRGNIFTYGSSQNDGTVEETLNILGGSIRLLEEQQSGKMGVEICLSNPISMDSNASSEAVRYDHYHFYVDTVQEVTDWFSILLRCTLPFSFPKTTWFDGSDEHIRIVTSASKIRQTPPHYQRYAIWNNLCLLALHFDFSMEQEAAYRSVKREVLLELAEVVESSPELVSDNYIFQEFMKAIELALFRTLHEEDSPLLSSISEEEGLQYEEPEWPHLSLVYGILLNLATSQKIDNSVRKHYITNAFVTRLISLFDSMDARERDYLKTVTHCIYRKLTNRRSPIRKAINYTFFEFLYESRSHRGVSELLEILASIINGFTLPIKEEHIVALTKSLIPLHKMRSYKNYEQQLSYCMQLFVSKDSSLAQPIISAILKYWPTGNTEKEILFLAELDAIFNIVQGKTIQSTYHAIAYRIARCLDNECPQVVERAFQMWSNMTFCTLLIKDKQVLREIAPVLYPPLRRWVDNKDNAAIRQIALHIIGMMVDVDRKLIADLSNAYVEISV